MARIIRRPKKVCTINKSGKKKCFTIQARRRMNPDEDKVLLIIVGPKYADVQTFNNFLEAFKHKNKLANAGYESIVLFDPINHIERIKKQLINLN